MDCNAWSEAGLVVERRDAVTLLTLDRPAQRNAIDRPLLAALGAASRALADDAQTRVVVLTHRGSVFCAGADLVERRGMSVDDTRGMIRSYRTELGALDAMPKPVIAALDGSAFGGGLELALCADVRVVAAHVELALPETSLGVIPGAGGTQRLTHLVGPAKAKELILLARRMRADEALALGVVNAVAAAPATALELALGWADAMLRNAPLALGAALEAIDAATSAPLEAGLEIERLAYERCLLSDDRLEALAAFGEKRRPAFRGR